MALHRRKTLKVILATVSILFLTVLFCISPCAVSRVYAAGSSDLSTQAVLSKSNFGTVKKFDNVYYIVDEFGNIIDTVSPTSGVDLDRYIGRQILVKDNLFAGLMESRQSQRNSFLGRLREYLSGIVPKPAIIKPAPIPEPIKIPDEDDPMMVQPMYGVFPPDPGDLDPFIPGDGDIVKPPIDPGMQLMYGVFPIEREIEEPLKEELPLRGKPTIAPAAEQIAEQSDKMDVIQKQNDDRAELAEKQIKVIPEPAQKKGILNPKKE